MTDITNQNANERDQPDEMTAQKQKHRDLANGCSKDKKEGGADLLKRKSPRGHLRLNF